MNSMLLDYISGLEFDLAVFSEFMEKIRHPGSILAPKENYSRRITLKSPRERNRTISASLAAVLLKDVARISVISIIPK